MKQPYPFLPFKDSLLGSIFESYFERKGVSREIQSSIESYLKDESTFIFTPRVEKQIILDTFPIEIRKFIKKNEPDKIIAKFKTLLISEKHLKMDVVLELLEWLLIGFTDREMQMQVLNQLFPTQAKFDMDFLNYFYEKYDEVLATASEEQTKDIS